MKHTENDNHDENDRYGQSDVKIEKRRNDET